MLVTAMSSNPSPEGSRQRALASIPDVREPTGVASAAVSAQTAAALLGVHERTIRRAIERGELDAIKQGGRFAIPIEALERYRGEHDPARIEMAPPRPRLTLAPTPADRAAPAAPVPLFEPARPAPALPAPLTPFIGRELETAAVTALLRRDGVRLVTLIGPGGVGKTRLSLRVAEALASEFADGVAFVPLAPIRAPELVVPAIAQAVGARDDDRAPLEALIVRLHEREMLVVLDNMEQATASAPDLATLLAGCPGLTLLVTSRTPLRLSGERLFDVPPLALPRPHAGAGEPAVASPSALAAFDAIHLFVDRAEAASGGFRLTAANAATVAAICARTDGLPLAIELAAARVRLLSPAELLERLERQLPLLTGGPRDQPARLRTVRNAVAWSYELLAPNEQALFRRLAVFAGGVSLASVEAFASSFDANAPTLDLLAALVDGSLLHRSEHAAGDSRFGMLETVREFALERLAAAGETDAARAAHAAVCLAFVERAQDALWAAASERVLSRCEAEHDNMRTALAWTIERDPATALRLASGLSMFWSKRAHWSEGRAWLERALAADAGGDSAIRAAALGRAGAIAGDQGEFDAARQRLEASLAMAERLGEAGIAARAERGLGILASNQSDFIEAAARFTAALARFRELGDRPGIARCLNDLGLVAGRQGDQDRAIAYQEEALPIARALGDDWQICIILGNLGGAYSERGDAARAEAMTEEALALARQLGDAFGVAVNLFNLGSRFVHAGDPRGAIDRFRECLQLTQELDERHLASRVLDGLGAALHLTGASRAAARLYGAAEALREQIGDRLFADEAADLAPHLQAAQDALGMATYEAVASAGRSLPFEVAVAEAIALADSALAETSAPAASSQLAGLTTREREVLRLLVDGRSDKEIANLLFISRSTASKHVAAILAKLDAESRTAAVTIAHRQQLI
jgi:excisionase family DNA binding protein